MSIAFEILHGSFVGPAQSGGVTITAPSSGFAAGDVLIAILSTEWTSHGQTYTPSLPGWTLIGQSGSIIDDDPHGTGGVTVDAWVRVAQSGDVGASWTYQQTSAGSSNGGYYSIGAYSGVSTSTPVSGAVVKDQVGATGVTTFSLPSVTVPSGGLAIAGAAQNMSTSSTSAGTLRNNTITNGNNVLLEGGNGATLTTNASGAGAWSGVAFALNIANTAPTCALSTPADLLPVATPPALTASITDPDASQTDTVTFQVSTDSTFATGVTTLTTSVSTPASSAAATVTPSNNLTPGRNYYRAHAVDSAGADSGWTAARSFYLDPMC